MSFAPRTQAQVIPKAAIERTRSRMGHALLLFSLVFAVLFARLVEVTALRDEAPRKAGVTVAQETLYRAPIVDRNGEILATDIARASLYADTRTVQDPVAMARELKSVLPSIDEAAVARKLAVRQAFVWIKRDITPAQWEAVNQLGLPQFRYQPEARRTYPNGHMAAHVLGYVNVDNAGLAGIELGFERHILERRNSDDVVELSIDLRVQHALEDELGAAMKNFSAKAATGIVLDVNTGEILAMSSLPDFDPNRRSSIKGDAMFNRATLGVYEMGSTFKIFTVAAALDSGRVTLESTFDAREPIKVGNNLISDLHSAGRILSVPEIFVTSSNVGSAKVALATGTEVQKAFLEKLGMLAPMPTEMREAGTPLLPQRWGDVETMTVSFGHGISVTPLHVAVATAAMVNGGRLIRPTLLRRDPLATVPFTRVISEKTSEQVRQLMRQVVTNGTGKQADVPGYPVGGKTGTAEKPNGRGYDTGRVLSSFVGVFPAMKPSYAVLVILDEPHGTAATDGRALGGWTAAPTAGKVISRIAQLLNVAVSPVETGTGAATEMASYEELH